MTEKMLDVSATWVPNVRCPRCSSKQVETYRTMPTAPGDSAKIRYHRCRVRSCRCLFKSTETIAPEVATA